MLRHVPPDSESSSGTEGISDGSEEVTCGGRGRVGTSLVRKDSLQQSVGSSYMYVI